MFTCKVITPNQSYVISRWVSREDYPQSHHPKKSLMPQLHPTKLPSPQLDTDTDSSMMRQLGLEPEPSEPGLTEPEPRPRAKIGGEDGGT